MVEEINASGQGAKIQRKTALLTVQPEVVVQGAEINAVVQSFEEKTLLRLNLCYPSGVIIEQIQVTGDSPVSSVFLKIPEGFKGNLRVILEARRNGYWMPAADQNINVLPDYWHKLAVIIKNIESIESSKNIDITQKRSAWAALAYAEDLMDRVKFADVNSSWELEYKLSELEAMAKTLGEGKNPLADNCGYQLRGYRSDLNNEIQPYSLYLPKGYGIDAEQKWPMVVMLHGAWSNHHLALRRVFGVTNDRGEDDISAKRVMPDLPDVPFIVVSPNGYETMCYRGFAEDDVWRVINEVEEMFNVDQNRIYLTGLSMGGGGTGMLGMRHADRFAAIAPVCAFFGAFLDLYEVAKRPEFLQWPENAISTYHQAENAFQLPVKLMHGDVDPIVPVHNSHALYAKLQKLGYQSEIEVYPGVGHDAWVPAYENARIFDWFAQFERNPSRESDFQDS
jgi:predicted peptidase